MVTYDWHQDLCPPYEDEIEGLKSLKTEDNGEVIFYTWAKLAHTNDVQIYAALLLNKIKDVYVICRQNTQRKSNFVVGDFYGNNHNVFIFKSQDEFQTHIPKIEDEKLYFDIDLDYFTINSPQSMGGGGSSSSKSFTYMKEKDIVDHFSYSNPSIKFVIDRLAGFTIATEPGFCGGLRKSNRLFHLLEDIFFTEPLFNDNMNRKWPEWNHLKNIDD